MIEKQKKYVNNENYIKIKGFMVNEMGLKGTSLFIYAIIYGMLQNNLKCTASIRYFEEWTNCSRSCVISAINKLLSEGLIQKESYEDEFGQIRTSYLIEEINEFTCKSHYMKKGQNNGIHNNLKSLQSKVDSVCVENKPMECKKHTGVVQKMDGGSTESAPYNINNNIKNNNINYIPNHIYHSNSAKKIEKEKIDFSEIEKCEADIKNNIDYQFLAKCSDCSDSQIDEIVNLLTETVSSKRKYIHVAGEDYPSQFVKNRLLSLSSEHIEYVIDSLNHTDSEIKNIKAYLLTALFNAPITMNNYYSAKVNFDLHKSKTFVKTENNFLDSVSNECFTSGYNSESMFYPLRM